MTAQELRDAYAAETGGQWYHRNCEDYVAWLERRAAVAGELAKALEAVGIVARAALAAWGEVAGEKGRGT